MLQQYIVSFALFSLFYPLKNCLFCKSIKTFLHAKFFIQQSAKIIRHEKKLISEINKFLSQISRFLSLINFLIRRLNFLLCNYREI